MMQVQSQPRPPQFGAPHHPYVLNGQVPGVPPQPVQLPPQQKIIEKAGVRILCIADVRGAFPTVNPGNRCSNGGANRVFFFFSAGNLRSLNELAKKANADHILHTGDFGFYDDSSLERIADKSVFLFYLKPDVSDFFA